jgi:hypothetical protein
VIRSRISPAQYFGNYRSRPREIRQTLQSLGSGFIVDPAGYIITNQHVVERAADLKIEVTMNDGKTYNARYITGDEKKDLAFIKIDVKEPLPFISLDNLSPNLSARRCSWSEMRSATAARSAAACSVDRNATSRSARWNTKICCKQTLRLTPATAADR